jgi:hypothetical protein
MTTKKEIKNPLDEKLNIYGAITTPKELIRETMINFMWGFMGNSIVVFMSKEIDVMVFLNFIFYYMLISYIVNRDKYRTRLGRFIILPGSAALGAYTGYKVAQYVSIIL